MLRRSILFAGLSATLNSPAHAKHSWPSRPIRLVVPFPTGGAVGIWARLVAGRVGHALGEPVLVEHRGATGTLVGTAAVARAPADGHTLLFTASPHVTAPLASPRSTYDPLNDFAPVGRIGSAPLVLVASPAFQGTTLQELKSWLRQDGVNFGSPGAGSRGHAFGIILAEAFGVAVEHVPYAGEAPMVSDLANGGLSFAFCSPAAVGRTSGQPSLRILAATERTPLASLAAAPLLVEEGFSDEFAIGGFVGVFAPRDTPQPVLDRAAGVLYAVMSEPLFRETLVSAYLHPHWQWPAEFGDHLERFVHQWDLTIRRRRLQPAD